MQDVYDNMIYDNLLPLYFPRSASEELDAARLLPLHNDRVAASAKEQPVGGPASAIPADLPSQQNSALAALLAELKTRSTFADQGLPEVMSCTSSITRWLSSMRAGQEATSTYVSGCEANFSTTPGKFSNDTRMLLGRA